MSKKARSHQAKCSRCGAPISVPETITGAWSAVCAPCLDSEPVKLRGATRRVTPLKDPAPDPVPSKGKTTKKG